MKRVRQYPSGSIKRKRKSDQETCAKKLNVSMENFLLRKTPSSSTDVCDTNETLLQKEECISSIQFNASSSEITDSQTVTPSTENPPVSSSTVDSPFKDVKNDLREAPDVRDTLLPCQKQCSNYNLNSDSAVSDVCAVCLPVSNNTAMFDYNDPALWPPVTDSLREYFILNKPNQNIDHLESSKRTVGDKERMCSASNFVRVKKNGEIIKRDWLVYSPSSKAVFCYICKLYSSSDQALSKNGFTDWRNICKRLSSHENSSFHRESVYSFSQRSAIAGRIDCNLIEQYKTECSYWKKVLYRVVGVIKFISQRGLAFFGENESFGSVQNGNFLGILELLSSFDPFLSDHINTHGNKGKGNVSYFSSTIVAEFIELMSKKVLNEILAEVKQAKYFGLIIDSTPDITHIDQLSVVLRYIDILGEPVERFIKFIPIHGHSSEHLQEVVVNLLENLGIDLRYCRGQSYDNASNMSGKYSGLQARLRKDFPFIEYVPCSAHSLNLVGTSAAECCSSAVSFFGLIQSLYNFFSVSTHRWELLSNKICHKSGMLTLKSLSTTRWSANADAVKVLRKNYTDIISILTAITKDVNETAATRNEANSLFLKMQTFEFALMVVIWDTILQRMNSVNKTIQSINCEMAAIVPLYDSLESFVKYVRNNFENYENEAESLVGVKNYTTKRKRVTPKSKMLDDSASTEVQLSDRERFQYQTHYVICDSIITELNKRKNAYSLLESRFGFMCSRNMTNEEIEKAAKNFQKIYSEDVGEEFPDEFLQFKDFQLNDLRTDEKLKTIKSLGIGHTFPNVETALRMMLSIPITNCSSERSFSVLKRIKNRLRSTLSGKNLSGLSLLAIESDLTEKICFDDVIEEFASTKSRKKPL